MIVRQTHVARTRRPYSVEHDWHQMHHMVLTHAMKSRSKDERAPYEAGLLLSRCLTTSASQTSFRFTALTPVLPWLDCLHNHSNVGHESDK